MPNSPIFSAAKYIKKTVLKIELFCPILEWCKISENHVYAHIFAWMLVKPLFLHLHTTFFSSRGSFVNCLQILDDKKEYINSMDSI